MKQITARIDDAELAAFEGLASERGYSVSSALRVLIQTAIALDTIDSLAGVGIRTAGATGRVRFYGATLLPIRCSSLFVVNRSSRNHSSSPHLHRIRRSRRGPYRSQSRRYARRARMARRQAVARWRSTNPYRRRHRERLTADTLGFDAERSAIPVAIRADPINTDSNAIRRVPDHLRSPPPCRDMRRCRRPLRALPVRQAAKRKQRGLPPP